MFHLHPGCICMCACMYVCTHVFNIHSGVRKHAHSYVRLWLTYTYMHTCIHVPFRRGCPQEEEGEFMLFWASNTWTYVAYFLACTRMYICMYTVIYMHTRPWQETKTFFCEHTNTCKHACAHTHVHTYTVISARRLHENMLLHTYTHAHIHT
jgi:hypothetical protein